MKVVRIALGVLSLVVLGWLLPPASASAGVRHHAPASHAALQACECEADHEAPAGAAAARVEPLRHDRVLEPVSICRSLRALGAGRALPRPARQ